MQSLRGMCFHLRVAGKTDSSPVCRSVHKIGWRMRADRQGRQSLLVKTGKLNTGYGHTAGPSPRTSPDAPKTG